MIALIFLKTELGNYVNPTTKNMPIYFYMTINSSTLK